ncbi:MAG: hypothetical protein JSW51_14885 [Gemmatimonadota bacterium]|nr:MAG: hypothetical protein JSW51_14885 [Gemmatimonadota bacterium]
MSSSRLLIILICAAAPLSCARGNSGSGDPERSEVPTPAAQSAASLVGNWDLASDPPLPPPGLHMSFTVDSVDGATYYGRLSHYFSGNVGGDLSAFKPFTGSMGDDGSVEFRADMTDPDMLGIVVVGLWQPDTIRVNQLVVGPDTLSARSERIWLLLKG